MSMGELGARAGRYLGDALRGVRRAPVEVLATLCIAFTFSSALEINGDAFQAWTELTVACLLLIAVAWTGTLLHAMGVWSAIRRWTFTAVGAIAVALYAIAVVDFELAAEHWRAAMLVAAAVLWLFALPAFAGPVSVDRMRRIDGRILLRMIGAFLYGAALFAGLALALRAIDVLFELRLDGEIYGHVFGWIFFVLVPWIVLGGLPDYIRPIEQTNEVAGVAHRIAVYLVPPLLAVYYLILFAYVVRIALTGEVPKNLVSPMVLAAGGLGALALLLFDPRSGGSGLARGLRLAPPLFLPLVPLGAWALIVRIDQYGWTEFRMLRLVVLGALAALAIAGTVQLVRRRSFSLHAIPLALAVVLLLGAIGPWSVLAMSRRSQQERLVSALARVDVPAQDSTYGPAPSDTTTRIVPAADYEQIRSSAQYLAGHFGTETLPPVLRRYATDESRRWTDYPASLGLRPDAPTMDGRFAMGGSLPYSVPVELQGGTAYRITWIATPGSGAMRGPGSEGGSIEGVVMQDSARLSLQVAGRALYADLAPLLGALTIQSRAAPARSDLPIQQAVVPLTDLAGVEQGQLLVWHLWAQSDSAGLQIGNLEGLVVVQ